jgi:hypothetical protein
MKFLKFLFILSLIVTLFFIFVNIAMNRFFLPWFLAKMEQACECESSIDFVYCDIFTPALSCYDVHVRGIVGDDKNELNFAVAKIRLRGNWLEILRNAYHLEKIEIEGAQCELIRVLRDDEPVAKFNSRINLTFLEKIIPKKIYSLVTKDVKKASPDVTSDVNTTVQKKPFTIVIDEISIQNSSFILTDSFPEDHLIVTTSFGVTGAVRCFQFPTIGAEKTTISLASTIRATQESQATLNAIIDSFYPTINFRYGLFMHKTYVPHFNEYFTNGNYDVDKGELDVISHGVCTANTLDSKYSVTLSECHLNYISTEKSLMSGVPMIPNISNLSGSPFVNVLNSIAKKEMTLTFNVNGNVKDADFSVKEGIKREFKESLKKRIAEEIAKQGTVFQELTRSLVSFSTSTPEKILKGGTTLDTAVQDNISKTTQLVFDSLKSLLEEKH